MRAITHIVIHCSATPNGDARITVKDLDRMHREKGWKQIGYHYAIHVDGELHEGRPVEMVGAHVEGNNATSIGVCVIGTERFTAAQWETLRDLVTSLMQQFPQAVVMGHRDFSPDLNGDGLIEAWEWFKVCPGFDVRAWLVEGMDPMWNPQHIFVKAAA